MMPGPIRAAIAQYWLVLLAIAAVFLFAVFLVIALPRNPCSDTTPYATYYCYKHDIGELLSLWAAGLILVGPIPAFRYQYRKVKRGERFVIMGVMYAVAGSAVSSLSALAVIAGAIYLDQTFRLFNLFSGDAGFAVLALEILVVGYVCLTLPIALIVFWITRKMRPNSTVEADARIGRARSSP